jgi:hypothetical protein
VLQSLRWVRGSGVELASDGAGLRVPRRELVRSYSQILRNSENAAFVLSAELADLVGVEFDSGSVGCGVHYRNL